MNWDPKKFESFHEAYLNDGIVSKGDISSMAGLQTIIVNLANTNQFLVKRILDLEAIAPRKYKIKDQVLIWQCPVDLIPETKLDGMWEVK